MSDGGTVVLKPVIPQDGQQAIAAGATETFKESRARRAHAIELDIPENMDATIRVNGIAILGVTDAKGRAGAFQAPDGKQWRIDEITVELTNNDSVALDAGLWLVIDK